MSSTTPEQGRRVAVSTHQLAGMRGKVPPPELDFNHISIEDVSRHYGRRRALSHVSLTLARGDLVALLGPNGAGKSTLLSLLATLIMPSSGVVRYGGHTVADGGIALRRQVGLLSHDLQLYSELTARENLEFFGALYSLDDSVRCASEALERAGLDSRSDDLVESFSRGMRQRLALERTLLHRPRLVLLDEPFTGLDERSARALVERLRTIQVEQRIVILATHDLELVDGLVDRAVLLQRGRMTELNGVCGSLRERYREELGKEIVLLPPRQ